MRRLLLWSPILLSACAPADKIIRGGVYVPAELRMPERRPDRPVQTNTDLALLLIDYDEALSRANGKIESIDTILDSTETAVGE